MISQNNPEQLLADLPRLSRADSFDFFCGPQVACYNECCADLTLVLSPYDVLRLRRATGLSSAAFLAKYATPDRVLSTNLPQYRLRMNDDPLRSCPFVSAAGCGVYADRPGACRAYPVGRGTRLDARGQVVEELVLVPESHCRGHGGPTRWRIDEWWRAQGLPEYDAFNDSLMKLIAQCQQRQICLSPEQHEAVAWALYQVEAFAAHHPDAFGEARDDLSALAAEERVLAAALDWVWAGLTGVSELRRG